MSKQNQPQEQDAVLGGQMPPPASGAVLGGMDGLKQYGMTILKGSHSFEGKTKYIEIPDQPFLNFATHNFSLSAWLRTSRQRGIDVIFDKRVETSGPVQGYTVSNYNGTLVLQLADGKGRQWTNYHSSMFIADHRWHNIVVTIDRQKPDGIRWYLDGIESSQPNNPTGRMGTLDNPKPLVIGRRSDHPKWPGYFHGSMADIRLFRSILTPIQIEQLASEQRD